jgi:hypothetical protein
MPERNGRCEDVKPLWITLWVRRPEQPFIARLRGNLAPPGTAIFFLSNQILNPRNALTSLDILMRYLR